MRKIVSILGVIGALTLGPMISDAAAFPISSVPAPWPDVTLIAGGCGIGYHRGPYGGCLPNAGYPAVGYGGYYRGGVYRGGAYRGGVYRGGGYRGGAYRGGGYHRGGVHRR